jgi:tetratricopeptide (TPR) repeat protein
VKNIPIIICAIAFAACGCAQTVEKPGVPQKEAALKVPQIEEPVIQLEESPEQTKAPQVAEGKTVPTTPGPEMEPADRDDVPDSVKKAQESFKEAQQGDAAAEKGDIDAAIEHYEKTLELAPHAPRFRFTYAQLLYWKGLSFAQKSYTAFEEAFSGSAEEGAGEDSGKEELKKASAEDRVQSITCFNKALKELERCDVEWNYAVEAVPYAKGIIYVFLEDYDKAIESLKRVIDSPRTSDEYRKKIEELVKKIEECRKELGNAEDEKAGEK